MMDVILLLWIAAYVTMATILFNILRHGIKINLPSSFILGASIPFLIARIYTDGSMTAIEGWLAEYFWAIIVLGGLIAIIVVMGRGTKKGLDSIDIENHQRKNLTVIFRIRKG